MSILNEIRESFALDRFVFSKHATDQAITRSIQVEEIRKAIITGEVLEDYPEDKYGPSCLILGFTEVGRPLHIQCTYAHESIVRVITVYEPNGEEWIDYRVWR